MFGFTRTRIFLPPLTPRGPTVERDFVDREAYLRFLERPCPNPQLCIQEAIDELHAVLNATTSTDIHRHMRAAFRKLEDADSLLF